MTEIPEHLLKRSKERRSAMGLGGDDGDADTGSSDAGAKPAATPAKAEAPAPVLAAPPPETKIEKAPEPDKPYVAAAKNRQGVPGWIVPILAFLPFWALVYGGILEEREAEATGLLAVGAEVYNNCASCHGANGGGGVGPQLSGGEVLLTFPDIKSQIEFVANGSVSGEAYGDAGREGGQRIGSGGMPAFGGSLSEEELKAVVCHERVTFGGATEEDEPSCFGDAEHGGGHGGGSDH